jgi:hypothetical protein
MPEVLDLQTFSLCGFCIIHFLIIYVFNLHIHENATVGEGKLSVE